MIDKNSSRKLFSILVICILIVAGIVLILPSSPIVSKVEGASVWVQTTDIDFGNGTLDNLTIVDLGSNANLELNLLYWVEKNPSTKPSSRINHAMASIYGTDNILLFGGSDGSDDDETWIYDLSMNNWANKNPSTKPSPREDTAISAIYGTNNIVLFGGEVSLPDNETWIYNLASNNWVEKYPKNAPNVTRRHAMAYIHGTDKIILFGGIGSGISTLSSETWEYDVSENNWTQKFPSNKPTERMLHSMAPIYGTNEVILFGGSYWDGSKTVYLDDTWIYNLTSNSWIEKQQLTKPGVRNEHAIASIYGTDKIILHGGNYGGNETWIYDLGNNTWTEIKEYNKHYMRNSHAMAPIYGTDKVILFGGTYFNQGWVFADDTWEFDPLRYINSGIYISNYEDTGTNSSFKTLDWSATVPSGTNIKFQLRTAGNKSNLINNSFVGTSGSPLLFYTSSPATIWPGHNKDKWIQYKIYFSTSDEEKTPTLQSITIAYNNLPGTTIYSPNNQSLTSNNKPTFIWNFSDQDSIQQSAYQVIIDDNIDFSSVNYDTNVISSSTTSYTPSTPISDGIWYWKVKTKDDDGDWGDYSNPFVITIDSTPPNSFIPIANPNEWTSTTQPVISFFTTDALSGINHFEVKINSGTFSTQTSPYTLPSQPNGIHNITVRAYDNASNYFDGYVNIFIDTDYPESFSPTANPNSWTDNIQPVISFSTTDITSDIDHYDVKIDEGIFSNQFSPYILPLQTDGIHNITIRAFDKAGNYREGYVEVYIDTAKPSIFTPIADPNGWTNNTQPLIYFSTTDDTSGIDHYKAKIDDGVFSTQSGPYKLPSQPDGIHNITVKAIDLVGNYREGYVNVFIDSSPPSITHTPITSGTKGFPITITAIISDEFSGIDKVELFFKKQTDSDYSILLMASDDSTYSASIPAESVTEDGIEYYIKVTDKSSPTNVNYFEYNGQTTLEPGPMTDIDITISQQDKTPPTITHLPVTTGNIGKVITFTATVTDDVSGVEYVELHYKKKNIGAYSNITMTKYQNTYSAEIPAIDVTVEGLEYFIKAADKALPPNVAYFGTSGQVLDLPNSLNDIDVSITEKDTTPPIILDYSPVGDNIHVGTAITITFSESMDKSATENAIFITPSITGTISWNGNILIYTLEKALNYNTTYSVIIDTGAKDVAGNNLTNEFDWKFTITSIKDTTPPKIEGASPTGTNVHLDTTISIKFNELMLQKDTEVAFSILPGVNGTFQWVGETLIFTPNFLLEYNTQYKITISTNAKDLVGNNLNSEYSLLFTTTSIVDLTPPTVVDFSPKGSDASINSVISIQFSESMNTENTEAAFSISPTINGIFTWDENTLIFTSSTPLDYNTKYEIIISINAADLMGNSIETEERYSFTTEEKTEDKEDTGMFGFSKICGLDIFLILLIIIIIIILLLLILHRRKPEEEKAEPDEEESEEIEEEYGEDEEEEIEETEEPEEEPEVEEEIEDLELPVEEEPAPEIEPDEEIDLDLFDDTELAAKPAKPEKDMVPKKGKKPEKGKPPMKGKKPEKGKPPKKDLKPEKPKKDKIEAPKKTEIEEIELEAKAAPAITPSNIEGDFEPELIKLEDKSVQCGICLGVIKTGLMAIKCECGKLYHESCGVRVGECPRCDRKFILEKLAKMKQEEIETLEEKEESKLSTEEFEQQLELKEKDKRGEFAEILDGLEKRLAKGEISEETYLMLRKKYEQ